MRAANMQVLTDEVKQAHPGVVIYGVGDEPHKLRPSDHNEDDTPGSRPAQTDPDNKPEHRAIDIMIGPAFTKADGDALVAYLLKHCRARLNGLIWHGKQWWRSTGFAEQPRTTDRHDDHVHASGLASDDENTSPWLQTESEDEMAYPESLMKAFPWQYIGGGIPEGRSALWVFNKTYEQSRDALAVLAAIRAEQAGLRAVVETLAQTIKAGGGNVDIVALSTKIDEAVNRAVAELTAETRDAVADLGEGGSAQVRADA